MLFQFLVWERVPIIHQLTQHNPFFLPKRSIFWFALLCSLVISSPVQAKEDTILIYGDSLSAAYGLPKEQGWSHLLHLRFKERNLPYRIVNASISGETTSGGLSRFAQTLQLHRPKILVLELGANDGLRGLSLQEMRKNLTSMIQQAQKAHIRVLLLGMMIPPNYGPRYTKEFKSIYAELADEYTLGFVPFFLEGVAGNVTYIQYDGLHPNSQAQPILMQTIWQALQPELKRKP